VEGERLREHFGSRSAQLVVATRWAAFGAGALDRLPSRAYEAGPLQPPEDGINRPALQSSLVEEIEAVPDAAREGDEDQRRGASEANGRRHGRVARGKSTYVEYASSTRAVKS